MFLQNIGLLLSYIPGFPDSQILIYIGRDGGKGEGISHCQDQKMR